MTESISTTFGYISVSIFDGQEEHHCHGNIEDDSEKVDLNHHEVRKGHSALEVHADNQIVCQICIGEGRIGDK